MEIKKNKVFISHSNKGVEIVKAFVELLEDIGMPEDSMFVRQYQVMVFRVERKYMNG